MAAETEQEHALVIKEGDRAILKKGRNMSCIEIKAKKKYQLEKMWFQLDGAVGQQYGATFEAKGNKISVVPPAGQDDLGADVEVDRDNRNLMDTSDNQKLDHDDIEQMRKDGLSGQNIIEQLVENSATFKVKTEYAQEKYIRRKKRKHLPQFQILRPCTRLLAEMYFNKGPSKICNLRADSLAQMLTWGNVRAHNKMLVFETCLGLLTGAVMERLGGYGTVVQVHTGEIAAKTAVEAFNFPNHYWEKLHYYPVRKLPLLKKDDVTESDFFFSNPSQTPASGNETDPTGETDSSNVKEPRVSGVNGDEGSSIACKEGTENEDEGSSVACMDGVEAEEEDERSGCVEDAGDENGVEDEPPTKKSRVDDASEKAVEDSPSSKEDSEQKQIDYEKQKALIQERKQRRFRRLKNAFHAMKQAEFDGLLVACRVYPTSVVLELLNYVLPSRPVVIFSQYKEPLLDCYMKLRDTRRLLNLRFTETWWRNYQVLPNRTHPEIQMNNYSGYLLTGITCAER